MTAAVPLTWMQHRMLEAYLVGDDPAMFVTQIVLPRPEPLDPDRVRRAWQATGRAVAALRARLVQDDEQGVVQLIDPAPEPLAVHDLPADVDGPDLERAIRPWLDRRSRLTGVFGERRLCRLDLVRHPRWGDALVFSFNHIVLDGRSMSIVLAQLAAPAPAPDDLDTYRAHGRRHAGTGRLDPDDLEFWTDLAQPAATIKRGGTPGRRETCLRLSAELSRRLVETTRAARVTVAALIHVLCVLAVEELAGGDDVLVTTAVSLPGDDDPDDVEIVGNRLVYLPFRLTGAGPESYAAAQGLLIDLYDRVWTFPLFLDRCAPAERIALAYPSVALAVGNFPTPAELGGTQAPFSAERPGAPLAVYAVPGDRFAFQLVQRGPTALGDPDRVADALLRACARLAGRDAVDAADRWSVGEYGWTRASVLETLRRLWAGVLRVPTVADTEGFVTLGGGPLAALRVVRAVEHEIGVRLPTSALLADPPLAAVADLVSEAVRVQEVR